MKKKILFSAALPLVSTVVIVPPVATVINNNVVPQLMASNLAKANAPAKLTEQPATLQGLKDANIDDIVNLKQYDSRKYGIVTRIKNQGSEGLC